MRRAVKVIGILTILAMTSVALPSLSQTKSSYKPPRTADGKPSLEGAWTNATITSLERPARFKDLVIPDSEIEKITNEHPQVVRQRNDDKMNKDTKFDGKDL